MHDGRPAWDWSLNGSTEQGRGGDQQEAYRRVNRMKPPSEQTGGRTAQQKGRGKAGGHSNALSALYCTFKPSRVYNGTTKR